MLHSLPQFQGIAPLPSQSPTSVAARKEPFFGRTSVTPAPAPIPVPKFDPTKFAGKPFEFGAPAQTPHTAAVLQIRQIRQPAPPSHSTVSPRDNHSSKATEMETLRAEIASLKNRLASESNQHADWKAMVEANLKQYDKDKNIQLKNWQSKLKEQYEAVMKAKIEELEVSKRALEDAAKEITLMQGRISGFDAHEMQLNAEIESLKNGNMAHNAEIASLQGKIVNLESQVNKLESEQKDLKSDANVHTTETAKSQSKISDCETRIELLKSEKESLENGATLHATELAKWKSRASGFEAQLKQVESDKATMEQENTFQKQEMNSLREKLSSVESKVEQLTKHNELLKDERPRPGILANLEISRLEKKLAQETESKQRHVEICEALKKRYGVTPHQVALAGDIYRNRESWEAEITNITSRNEQLFQWGQLATKINQSLNSKLYTSKSRTSQLEVDKINLKIELKTEKAYSRKRQEENAKLSTENQTMKRRLTHLESTEDELVMYKTDCREKNRIIEQQSAKLRKLNTLSEGERIFDEKDSQLRMAQEIIEHLEESLAHTTATLDLLKSRAKSQSRPAIAGKYLTRLEIRSTTREELLFKLLREEDHPLPVLSPATSLKSDKTAADIESTPSEQAEFPKGKDTELPVSTLTPTPPQSSMSLSTDKSYNETEDISFSLFHDARISDNSRTTAKDYMFIDTWENDDYIVSPEVSTVNGEANEDLSKPPNTPQEVIRVSPTTRIEGNHKLSIWDRIMFVVAALLIAIMGAASTFGLTPYLHYCTKNSWVLLFRELYTPVGKWFGIIPWTRRDILRKYCPELTEEKINALVSRGRKSIIEIEAQRQHWTVYDMIKNWRKADTYDLITVLSMAVLLIFLPVIALAYHYERYITNNINPVRMDLQPSNLALGQYDVPAPDVIVGEGNNTLIVVMPTKLHLPFSTSESAKYIDIIVDIEDILGEDTDILSEESSVDSDSQPDVSEPEDKKRVGLAIIGVFGLIVVAAVLVSDSWM
jgi:predicted  nucleic acid-binding Zn-ribbon protein